MSKWEDNKWKIFWSWVVLGVFAVTISILYGSERSKRIELEAEIQFQGWRLDDCKREQDMLFARIAELNALIPVDSAAQAKYEEIMDSIWSYSIDSSEVKDE